jgi:[acyl-carrier-protein] S-malonyltransferase
MIFPGQASQFVGMAQDLADGGTAGEWLGRVDAILGEALTSIMFGGPPERLTETRYAQPAILAHSVAAVSALRELDIEPSLVAGHSLGEYSAAVAAGALAPEDALRLVRRRGELMFAAGRETPGTMAAVIGLAANRVTDVCARVAETEGVVVLANHNSPAQVAISGEVDAVAAASEALRSAGARKVIPLQVSGAFHSPLLEKAAQEFRSTLAEIELREPRVPLIANVSAEPVTTGAGLRDGLERQLTAPVLWQETMEKICAPERGPAPAAVLEVGPGRVLANLARRTFPEVEFLAAGTREDLERLPGVLAGRLM